MAASILAKPTSIWLITVLLLLIGPALQAQKKGQSKVLYGLECKCKKLERAFQDKSVSSFDWSTELKSLKEKLQSYGYFGFEAVVDSSVTNRYLVSLNPGKKYEWFQIEQDDETRAIVASSGLHIKKLSGEKVDLPSYRKLLEVPLAYLENNGYPFAKVFLDEVSIEQEQVSARLVIHKGPLIRYDSVVVQGDLKVRPGFIQSYAGAKQGKRYSEKQIRIMNERLKNLSFATQFKEPQVFFNEDHTKVEFYLNERKVNRFDGLIGFLPNAEDNSLLITGDAKIHLENPFKLGEVIDVNWRKLQTRTQQLTAQLMMPFLFNTPLSADARGEIYRRDTLFTEVKGELGFRYLFGPENFVRASLNRSALTLISTSDFESSTSAPPFLDRNLTSYGVGFNFQKLDYLLNPSKGYWVTFSLSAGNKTIVQNPALPSEIYDDLNLNTLQVMGELDASYYWSPLKRLVLHQRLMIKTIQNDQLFNNEAHRIGGLLTLRGFNEEAIFSTSHAIVKNELRYQFEREGYAFLFFDGAWYENLSLNPLGPKRDLPFGFGAGFTFGTRAGIFNISYALGREQGNPILLRNNKIHFGFVSLF